MNSNPVGIPAVEIGIPPLAGIHFREEFRPGEPRINTMDKKLIEEGESESLEFKSSLSQINDIIATAAAFASERGGNILVGISDRGEVRGVQTGKDTIEQLSNTIKDRTEPSLYPSIIVSGIHGRKIIRIEVPESREKPVLASGRPYKRVGNSTHKMSREEYERTILKMHKEELRFDNRVCDATLNDLDEGKLRWFLKTAKRERGLAIQEDIPVVNALTQLKLLKDGKLTNAVILLFGKNLEQFIIQSEVKCIALPTTEFIKPYDTYQAYSDNLFEQVDKATAFVLENIHRPLWVEPGEIAARHPYELPREAVREAIVNAIVHRDYNSPSKVQVRVFPDRVEIWNPGQLPSQLSIDDLKKTHPSIPHNPLLFRQFYRTAYVEDVGGGTVDVISRCKDMGLPEPTFEQKMGSFVTTFWRSVLTDEYFDTLDLNERQKKAVKYIEKYRRITRAEYEKTHKVSERTANRELNDLLNRKIIEKKGRGPETYYVLARYGEIWRDRTKESERGSRGNNTTENKKLTSQKMARKD